MKNWNAGDPHDPNPFSTWVDSLAQAFVRLESEPFGDAPFAASIQQVEAGSIRISQVAASANRVRRTRRHILDARDDIVFVNLQANAVGLTRQHGRDVLSAPFDIAIADTLYPYDIVHDRRFSLFSVAVPRLRLPAELLREGHLRLSKTRQSRDLARMMMTYSLLALAPQQSRRAVGLFAEHIVDLVGLGISELGGETRTRAPEITIDLIQDFVRLNFRDHTLSAAAAARAFNLSERYIHKLFQKCGQTFSEFLCAVRLEECAQALAQPGAARPAVAALAFEAGFSDLSYFNRRFKSRFAAPPSEYRRRHLVP